MSKGFWYSISGLNDEKDRFVKVPTLLKLANEYPNQRRAISNFLYEELYKIAGSEDEFPRLLGFLKEIDPADTNFYIEKSILSGLDGAVGLAMNDYQLNKEEVVKLATRLYLAFLVATVDQEKIRIAKLYLENVGCYRNWRIYNDFLFEVVEGNFA